MWSQDVIFEQKCMIDVTGLGSILKVNAMFNNVPGQKVTCQIYSFILT